MHRSTRCSFLSLGIICLIVILPVPLGGIAYAARQLLFFDDFSDGTVGQADPQWEVVQGSWKVAAPAGYAGGEVMKSAKRTNSAALVRDDEIVNGGFVAGRISARFKIGSARDLPEMDFFFDSTGPNTSRDVVVRQKASGAWIMQLRQWGNYDGDTERLAAARKLRGFDEKHWHLLEIEVGAGGQVDITLTDTDDSARTWTLSGAFLQNSGASVGIWSGKTVVLVDDYTLEGPP